MVMKGCCFVWPYRSADRVKKPKSNFGVFFSSARNLFSSRGLPHDYGWVFSSTTVIMKFKIKDRKCIEICMTPEFSADMGSKWILALWVCVYLVSLCWEAQGGRTLCLVMGPALSLHALPGMNSFWDCCWDREQNFGKSTVGKVFPKLTRTPASILGRNPKGLEHWRKPERERGSCCQCLTHWSLGEHKGCCGGWWEQGCPLRPLSLGPSAPQPPSQLVGHWSWHGVSSLFPPLETEQDWNKPPAFQWMQLGYNTCTVTGTTNANTQQTLHTVTEECYATFYY